MEQENNVKITILKNDDTLITFLAEADFENDYFIYTEIPIDENSKLVDFDMDEKYHFYSTSLGCLLEKYQSIGISQIKK
jgi:hypothetical protein